MTTDLQKAETGALRPAEDASASQAAQLIQAVTSGQIAPEIAEKALEMAERLDATYARKAFARAMAAFQAECPTIPKSRDVSFSERANAKPTYSYAELEHICTFIAPYVEKHGLSYRWNSKTEGGLITTTCIVMHIEGHSEETTFTTPIDEKARQMNVTQQAGSSSSYGRRYSLIHALGLRVGEKDDDGRAGGSAPVDPDTGRELAQALKDSGADTVKFLHAFGVERMRDLPANKADEARALIEQLAEARAGK